MIRAPVYIEMTTHQARRLKWDCGAARYGRVFQGHPLLELDEELLDAMNYVAEAQRQGWDVGALLATLYDLRDEVRAVYRRQPAAPRQEGLCPTE